MISLIFFLLFSKLFFAASIFTLWIYAKTVLQVAFLNLRSRLLLPTANMVDNLSTDILSWKLFSMNSCAFFTDSSWCSFCPLNIINGDWLFRSISISKYLEQRMAISRSVYFSIKYNKRFQKELAPPLE